MRKSTNLTSWCCLAVLLVCATGCGEETATVSGVVLLDDNPLKIGDGMRGAVVFQPASRQGPTLSGMIDGKGHYSLGAGSISTLQPGIYLATVSAVEVLPATEENPQPQGRRITPDKYADAQASGFRFDIRPGVNNVRLELFSEESSDKESSQASQEELSDQLEKTTSESVDGVQ